MRHPYQGLTGYDVLVNLKTGGALRGRIRAATADHLDLDPETELIDRDSGAMTLDGVGVVVPNQSVDFVQVIAR